MNTGMISLPSLEGLSKASERSERAFGNGCLKGRQILLYVVNNLRDGWTNLGETFRDQLEHPGERPRERIF